MKVKKETSGRFLCETLLQVHAHAVHVLGGAVSKKYIRLPRTEITDNVDLLTVSLMIGDITYFACLKLGGHYIVWSRPKQEYGSTG